MVAEEDGSSGEEIVVEADLVAEGYNDTVATRRFRDEDVGDTEVDKADTVGPASERAAGI